MLIIETYLLRNFIFTAVHCFVTKEEDLSPMPRSPLSEKLGSSLMEAVPHAQLISGPFVTPAEWLEKAEFANHVCAVTIRYLLKWFLRSAFVFFVC